MKTLNNSINAGRRVLSSIVHSRHITRLVQAVYLVVPVTVAAVAIGAYGIERSNSLSVVAGQSNPVLWPMMLLTVLAGVVAPAVCFTVLWQSRERLETAALASRMMLTRVEGAHNAVAGQTERSIRELESQRDAISQFLRSGSRRDGEARQMLSQTESALRHRLTTLSQIPSQTERIADAVKSLGLLLSSPNALPKLRDLGAPAVTARPNHFDVNAMQTVSIVIN